MDTITTSTDAKGRVTLPKAFANATIIIEQLNDNELRLCKVGAAANDETRFAEETPNLLSNRDRQRFLQALDQPPEPNANLRELMAAKAKKCR